MNTEESDCNNTFLNSHVTLNEQTKRRFRLIEHFLTRWKHEFLTSLREFHRVSGNNIQRVKLGGIFKNVLLQSFSSVFTSMISDKATTFIAAAEEIRNLTESRTLQLLHKAC